MNTPRAPWIVSLTLATLTLALPCGCSFGVFSELADKAPAARLEVDGASSFGDHLVGLARGGTDRGGLLAITGNGGPTFALSTISGSASLSQADGADLKDQLNDPNRITSMAAAPSETAVGSAQGPFVYIGSITGAMGSVRVLDVSTVRQIRVYKAPIQPIQVTDFGASVVRADLGGGGTGDDLAVGATNTLALMRADGSGGRAWPDMLEDQAGNNQAALIQGDVDWPTGSFSVIAAGDLDNATPEHEVAAAVPEKNAVVVVHHVANCFQDTSVVCKTVLRIPLPSQAVGFGKALLIADVDNDGKAELVVGAPDADRVYVYDLDSTHFDPVTPAAPPTPITLSTSDSEAGDFGSSLALGKIDSGAKNLLVVGAPGSVASGSANAGKLYLFDSALKQVGDGVQLADPEGGTLMGRRLAVIPYRSGTQTLDLLAASGKTSVFVFFANLTSGHKDIRD